MWAQRRGALKFAKAERAAQKSKIRACPRRDTYFRTQTKEQKRHKSAKAGDEWERPVVDRTGQKHRRKALGVPEAG